MTSPPPPTTTTTRRETETPIAPHRLKTTCCCCCCSCRGSRRGRQCNYRSCCRHRRAGSDGGGGDVGGDVAGRHRERRTRAVRESRTKVEESESIHSLLEGPSRSPAISGQTKYSSRTEGQRRSTVEADHYKYSGGGGVAAADGPPFTVVFAQSCGRCRCRRPLNLSP